jgi:hypothetical protein
MSPLRRFVNWILGPPKPQDVEVRARLAQEQDRQRTEAIYQGDKSNLTGPRR